MAFFGRETVEADLDLHRDMAGGVTAGTLRRNSGFSDVPYANVCLWPPQEVTGVGGGGNANQTATVTAWRVGEADKPRADDRWAIGSDTWNIQSVTGRFTADESAGFAVYDCKVFRAA